MPTSIKVYGVPLSVHTRKVIMALRIKSIAHEIVPVVPVIPEACPPNWRTLSPTGLIPVIEDDGFLLADSTAILHYLERKHPEPALVPADLREMGAALFIDSWAGTALYRDVVRPIIHPIFSGESIDPASIDAALNKALPEAFGYLEARAGTFLVGKTLSIADLAVVSNLINFYFTGNRVDSRRFPRLEAYFRRHIESPAVAAILAAERPFLEGVPGLDGSILPTR